MHRRSFLLAALAARAQSAAQYRAAVIGHTGHGNYGHGLDVVWRAVGIPVVAVADPDDEGRALALKRTGAAKGYADYREMLDAERPDLVSVAPRWMDQNVAMVEAAAAAGAHIYMEKAFARDLEEADRMVAAVRRAGVKLQLAHQMRTSPYVARVREVIDQGDIGPIHEVRGRGKEDHRAGGEDLVVLGSHILDVFRMFLGDPEWVVAHVTQDGAELDASHIRQPTEPVGRVAGNQIAAMFSFPDGLHSYFTSRAADTTHPLRFGTRIVGERGAIFLPNAIYPSGGASILRTPARQPDESARWEELDPLEDPNRLARIQGEGHQIANALMVLDLLDAIEQDRQPVCSEVDGRWTTEMISGIYQSQLKGARVRFPLKDRAHPLLRLR